MSDVCMQRSRRLLLPYHWPARRSAVIDEPGTVECTDDQQRLRCDEWTFKICILCHDQAHRVAISRPQLRRGLLVILQNGNLWLDLAPIRNAINQCTPNVAQTLISHRLIFLRQHILNRPSRLQVSWCRLIAVEVKPVMLHSRWVVTTI